MYGYPIPHSTSHFVISVNSQFATNNPGFFYNSTGNIRVPGSRTQVISGTLEERSGKRGSLHTEITYQFHGVRLTQRLVPVSSSFRAVPLGSYGQHYRIEFDVENLCHQPVELGLLLQIDTMIDTNDAARMEVRGKEISKERVFGENQIPGKIFVFRNPVRPHGLTGVFTLNRGKATPPQEVYIGRWPVFYKTLWSVPVTENTTYGDSAVIMKWRLGRLNTGQRRYVATHYGVRKGSVELLHTSTKTSQHRLTVYFAVGSAALPTKWARKIDNFIAENNQQGRILGALVEGYADAVNNHQHNLRLSLQRALNLRRYLAGRNRATRIPKNKTIPKAFGESRADQSFRARRRGKPLDRKAEIILFVVPR
jgi:outer membrane protein OmpA-like peptidoglycan-associated protein